MSVWTAVTEEQHSTKDRQASRNRLHERGQAGERYSGNPVSESREIAAAIQCEHSRKASAETAIAGVGVHQEKPSLETDHDEVSATSRAQRIS